MSDCADPRDYVGRAVESVGCMKPKFKVGDCVTGGNFLRRVLLGRVCVGPCVYVDSKSIPQWRYCVETLGTIDDHEILDTAWFWESELALAEVPV